MRSPLFVFKLTFLEVFFLLNFRPFRLWGRSCRRKIPEQKQENEFLFWTVKERCDNFCCKTLISSRQCFLEVVSGWIVYSIFVVSVLTKTLVRFLFLVIIGIGGFGKMDCKDLSVIVWYQSSLIFSRKICFCGPYLHLQCMALVYGLTFLFSLLFRRCDLSISRALAICLFIKFFGYPLAFS